MIEGRLRALRPQRDQDGERPGRPRAEVRDVGGDEVDHHDRADLGQAEDPRTQADDDRVEDGHRRDADEIAPQRLQRPARDRVAERVGNAHVVLGPAADQRAVLEQEEQAQRGEREEGGERGERRHAGPHALQQRMEGVARRCARVVARALRLARADARVLERALRLVHGAVEGLLQLGRPGSSRPPAASRRCRRRARSTRRSTMAAPPPRPTRWRASQPTTGERTAAMIAAVMTGTTITEVSASSQTTPPSRSSTPTTSHAISPRSRSHDGTAKTRASWSDPTSTNVDSPPGEPAPPSSWTTRRRRLHRPEQSVGHQRPAAHHPNRVSRVPAPSGMLRPCPLAEASS